MDTKINTKTNQPSNLTKSVCPTCQKKFEGPYQYCIYDGSLLRGATQEKSLAEFRAEKKQEVQDFYLNLKNSSLETITERLQDQDFYFCFLREKGEELSPALFEKLPHPSYPLTLIQYLRISKKLGLLSVENVIQFSEHPLKKIRDLSRTNEPNEKPIAHLKLLEPPLSNQA